MTTMEIKFRAWNIQEERFEEKESFDCDHDDGSYYLVNHAYPKKDGFEDIYVFQQFTGLYDKHGKEIYEGDIITWDGYVHPACVTYEAPEFLRKMYTGKYPFKLHHQYEIIGNVYENKDLIK